MSATNSDNSEMKVIKVDPENILSHFRNIGCNNLSVAGTFCKVLNEIEQSLDTYSDASGNNTDTAGASDSNASSSSSSGAKKADIEFAGADIAFIEKLFDDPTKLQILKVGDTRQKEEQIASKDERE